MGPLHSAGKSCLLRIIEALLILNSPTLVLRCLDVSMTSSSILAVNTHVITIIQL